MKVKSTKNCKKCGNTFKIYNTTDKYCSSACFYSENKLSFKTTKTKIRQVSVKRQKELREYSSLRKKFLERPENKLCIVAETIFNEKIHCTEIHHKKGRIGKLLNYTPFWLAVSRKGHDWIHENPEEAYKLNFLIKSST